MEVKRSATSPVDVESDGPPVKTTVLSARALSIAMRVSKIHKFCRGRRDETAVNAVLSPRERVRARLQWLVMR